jgi:hypothetical protein
MIEGYSNSLKNGYFLISGFSTVSCLYRSPMIFLYFYKLAFISVTRANKPNVAARKLSFKNSISCSLNIDTRTRGQWDLNHI